MKEKYDKFAFNKYINLIEDVDLKHFTQKALSLAPDYFWTLLSSTSGRTHAKGQLLVDHVVGCLKISEFVIRQMGKCWIQLERDQLYSAVMLHDCWRCGEPGKEKRYTVKDVNERGYSDLVIGELRTDSNHGGVAAVELNKIKENIIDEENYYKVDPICDAIKYHYGPWSVDDGFNMSDSFRSLRMQVHNIDYMEFITSKIKEEI